MAPYHQLMVAGRTMRMCTHHRDGQDNLRPSTIKNQDVDSKIALDGHETGKTKSRELIESSKLQLNQQSMISPESYISLALIYSERGRTTGKWRSREKQLAYCFHLKF